MADQFIVNFIIFLFGCALGFIPLTVLYFIDKQLTKRCTRKQYLFMIIASFLLSFILLNLFYFPGRAVSFLPVFSLYSRIILSIAVLSITASAIVYIPASFLFRKYYTKNANHEHFVLRKKAGILAIVLVVLWFTSKPIKNYAVSRAMHEAQPAIDYIEQYHTENKMYPATVNMKKIANPPIIGADSFLYVSIGEHYYLQLAMSSIDGSTYVYDPDDVLPKRTRTSGKVKSWIITGSSTS